MTDEFDTHSATEPAACPFVAFEDDRDHRSDAPDYRHRCFASAEPEPRAFPHQERYCLSAGFTACPVFLDWARQEAAGLARPSTADADRPIEGGEEERAPAFLASRPRSATPPEPATPASRRTAEASAGLWSSEGVSRRIAPTAPPPPSSLVVPPVAMARRGPTHPGWENPPRLENFPRLRSRDERHSNAPLIWAAIGMAVFMVALVLLPVVWGRGGGSTTNPTQNPSASESAGIADATATPVPTPTPSPTPYLYTVGLPKTDPNLTVIAARYNVTVAMIVAFNQGSDFAIKNPNVIFYGMQFYIPPVGWVPPPPTAPPASGTPSPSPTPTA